MLTSLNLASMMNECDKRQYRDPDIFFGSSSSSFLTNYKQPDFVKNVINSNIIFEIFFVIQPSLVLTSLILASKMNECYN